ncbi:hypothetical protein NDU88_004959 [Pleurodeles waltl]|uniref:Uncharacterized protein n=1 Tax=Pleurodeles waltl TaxID=8319 RepID=A0AAV7QE80_PLEWA|nr:hypothetical protein NDU88_004959 [Pleurodeles waltl]
MRQQQVAGCGRTPASRDPRQPRQDVTGGQRLQRWQADRQLVAGKVERSWWWSQRSAVKPVSRARRQGGGGEGALSSLSLLCLPPCREFLTEHLDPG